MNSSFLFRVSKIIIVALFLSSGSSLAEPGCRNGGAPMANAFVLANPIYAHYFGDLPSYLAKNQAHFSDGGDAIRCATALSRALMSSSLALYDPADMQRKQEIDARMEAAGFGRGPQQPNAAGILFQTSMSLSRQARALPSASRGDFTAWNTPTNEIEQLQIAAEQILRILLQDPMTQSVLASMEPLIREAAQFDYHFLLQASRRLAKMQ
jgi:hypothetical protein